MDFEVNEYDKYIEIEIDDFIDKESIFGIIDDDIFDYLDSLLEPGTYFYYKGDTPALNIDMGERTEIIIKEKGKVNSLFINEESCSYMFCFENRYVSSYSSIQEKRNINAHLANFMMKASTYFPFSLGSLLPYYFVSMRTFSSNIFTIVKSKNHVSLAKTKENIVDDEYFHFYIVDDDNLSIVGKISVFLHPSDKDNFDYCGNVSYEVFPEFRHKGYATKALCLLKEYVSTIEGYNKDLYVSTTQDNIFSQNVALKSGGKLILDTKVPVESDLYLLKNIDHVLIYKI